MSREEITRKLEQLAVLLSFLHYVKIGDTVRASFHNTIVQALHLMDDILSELLNYVDSLEKEITAKFVPRGSGQLFGLTIEQTLFSSTAEIKAFEIESSLFSSTAYIESE